MTEGAVIEKRKFSAIDKWAYAAGDFGCNMSFALNRHQFPERRMR